MGLLSLRICSASAAFIVGILAVPVTPCFGTESPSTITYVEGDVPIKSITFSGNTVLSAEDLRRFSDDQLGRPADVNALCRAILSLEKAYRDKGLLLAVVSDVKKDPDGSLSITIIEGIEVACWMAGHQIADTSPNLDRTAIARNCVPINFSGFSSADRSKYNAMVRSFGILSRNVNLAGHRVIIIGGKSYPPPFDDVFTHVTRFSNCGGLTQPVYLRYGPILEHVKHPEQALGGI